MNICIGFLAALVVVGVSNSRADLVTSVPAVVGSSTSTFLFDESINHQAGFSISQWDARLNDLFNPPGPNGKSALCGPTSLANVMAYLKLWRSQPFPNLQLVQDPLQGDFSQVVRDFSKRCKTNPSTGTLVADVVSCVQKYFQDSGYNQPKISLIGTAAQGANFRAVTPDDIRTFVQKDYGVLLEMLWYTYDEGKKAWVTDKSGHYVAVVGEDYDASWGDHEIHLKVVNPDIDYRSRDTNTRWDSIQMLRFPVKDGVTYPQLTNYILDGFDFKGIEKRAFVRNVIAFLPI